MTVLRLFARRLRQLDDEGGWALAIAMMLMLVMVIGGLSLLRAVDTQTQSSAVERRRETSFNVAEAAMNAQMFALSRNWAGKGTVSGGSAGIAADPYPAFCTPSSTSRNCPSNTGLLAAFPGLDTDGATWTTTVRDDGVSPLDTFYDDQAIAGQPGYDANKNGKLWVRAQATVKGRTRTIVALVQAQEQSEDLLNAAVSAGRLDLTNEGNKPIVDGGGPVVVRCTPTSGESVPCLGHDLGQGNNATMSQLMNNLQVQVPGTTPVSTPSQPTAMTADAAERLKQRAIADGTYYATCPADAKLTGDVVWIVNGACAPAGGTINSPSSPGILVLENGTISLAAQTDFYGVVYAMNKTGLTGPVVSVHANGLVHGGVLVDGPGIVEVGSSGSNIIYDPNVFPDVKSYGTAAVIQNTWREIKGTLATPAS